MTPDEKPHPLDEIFLQLTAPGGAATLTAVVQANEALQQRLAATKAAVLHPPPRK